MKEVKRWLTLGPIGGNVMAVAASDFDAVLKELEGKLKVAREALNCLYPALVIDLRYNAEDDESREAFASRVKTVEEALALLDKEG
jgi:hypothetical protein